MNIGKQYTGENTEAKNRAHSCADLFYIFHDLIITRSGIYSQNPEKDIGWKQPVKITEMDTDLTENIRRS